jgi:hypothetical protein
MTFSCQNKIYVKASDLALRLFGAEEVLVAALGLGVGVLGALGVAGTTLIHVHFILDITLQFKF